MGQKVNPIGVRLKINRSWSSNWFAEKEEYGNNLIEDLRIRNYIYDKFLLGRNYYRVEVADINILRVGDVINIYVYNSRPGLLIGRKGQDIEKLKLEIKKLTKTKKKINISMNEIKDMDVNPHVIAQTIGKAIKNRIPYKRAIKQAITRTMRADAKGIKIRVAGRLNGADMSRAEIFRDGSVPLHTFDAKIGYSHYHAKTTYGIIGVTVWVYMGILTKKEFEDHQEKSFSKG